jgi:hypothetical protein
MSLTVFLAFCILGCDFLIFVLFKWLYGEKRREASSRSALGKHAMPSQSPLYYVPAKGRKERSPAPSEPPARLGPRLVGKEEVRRARRAEWPAHHEIDGSLGRRRA